VLDLYYYRFSCACLRLTLFIGFHPYAFSRGVIFVSESSPMGADTIKGPALL